MDRNILKQALIDVEKDKQTLILEWEQKISKNKEYETAQIVERESLESWLDALLEDIGDGTPDTWDSVAQREANRLVKMGVSENFFRIMLGALTTVLWDYALKRWYDTPRTALAFLREANIHIIRGRTEMARVFLDKRLEMINKQQKAIIELSTPVIPLLDSILIVPLIGTIDTTRANQIMENILYGIAERNAEIVIIDITGVHIVDSTVAHHLIKAYHAARLLGATCLLVGMRPEVAQTIAQLDIPFDQVITKNNLAQGIEYALQLQGRKIVEIQAEVNKIANSHTNPGD